MTIGAAIDIGSISVHLLVAAYDDGRLEALTDESVFLGLGDRVTSTGTIGPELRVRHVEALLRYAETARGLGASAVELVGTEALRRAGDTAWLVRDVEESLGSPLHVLDHAEEGVLTLLGVTSGRRVVGDLLVVDVGGGSSEFVVVHSGSAPLAAGVRLGSAALTTELVAHDPPTSSELAALLEAARTRVAAAPPARPTRVLGVGGTASNLAKVVPEGRSRGVITRAEVAAALDALVAEPSAAAIPRYGVNPVRARILPAGAAIVLAILDCYEADRIEISESGIREGLVLASLYAGRAWRDRLTALAPGWIP